MYNFVSKSEKVRIIRDMNIRVGEPSLIAKIISVPKGEIFSVIGYVTDGFSVNGNSKWYKNAENNYLWSGNVELVSTEVKKILFSPLAYLICTQKFGERPNVYKDFGSPKGHNGLDFRTWVDGNPKNWEQPVFTVLGGIVSEATNDPKYKGNYVRVKHENGFESVYLHLSKLGVQVGQKVEAGEKIGISGNSGGASEAPHLHFSYRPIKCDLNNGCMGYIDPAALFRDEIKYI